MVSLSNHGVRAHHRAMSDELHLWVYILRCADGSYYTGSTRQEPEARVWEHNEGVLPGYTHGRRPVVLVYAEHYERLIEGYSRERQIKGWSRAKKEALMAQDREGLVLLARSGVTRVKP
jgi:putative endonuclease